MFHKISMKTQKSSCIKNRWLLENLKSCFWFAPGNINLRDKLYNDDFVGEMSAICPEFCLLMRRRLLFTGYHAYDIGVTFSKHGSQRARTFNNVIGCLRNSMETCLHYIISEPVT